MLKVVYNSKKALAILVATLFFSVPFALLMGGGCATADTAVDYNVHIKPSLSIKASTNDVVINLNPNSKQFGTADLDVTVGTNNQYGYKLFMNTDSNETSLKRDDTIDGITTNATIPTLSASTTASTFPDNQWGYRINNNVGGDSSIIDTTGTNFYPYTPTPNPPLISSATEASNEQTANLTFGAKIDYTKPAGSYDLTLKFNALPTISTNYIQNLDPELCTEEPLVVIDSRDEQPYTVQRLKDGNCWMMTNLNLQHITNDLTPEDTNIAENTTLSASTFNGWKVDVATINYNDGEFMPITTENSSDGRDTDATTNTIYGTLYNFYATTAGTVSGSTNYANASYDICPAGWRLPTGGTGGEFENLYNQPEYNTQEKMHAPILSGGAAFTLPGAFDTQNYPSGNIVLSGSIGLYWSSTRSTTESMYNLGVQASNVVPNNSGSRIVGRSIRCIRDNRTISGISNMQDVTSIRVKNTPNGTIKTLTDTRDSKTYTVRKIDNDLWMTRNLAIGCNGTGTTYGTTATSKTLSSADSNISATSWATPTALLSGAASTDAPVDYSTARIQCNSSVGAWYNYTTASAGTVTGTDNTDDATSDICPKGWKMPSLSQINSIISSIGTNPDTIFNPPAKEGIYYQGRIYQSGTIAYFWSGTTYDNTKGYMMGYNDSQRLFLNYYARSSGVFVRCVAK